MKFHPYAKPILLTGLFLLFLTSYSFSEQTDISGKVDGGFRILTIQSTQSTNQPQTFTVYRGDYIKFDLPETFKNASIIFPGDDKSTTLTQVLASTPYFKMKQVGTRDFKINDIQGEIKGQIQIVEYQQERYQAVTASQAKKMIQTKRLLLLDVRTQQEYQAGHLENAALIPVQILKNHLEKLIPYKNEPILIYCASGNRSTVASKILIDEGFTNIINMRYGIREWAQKKYRIIR